MYYKCVCAVCYSKFSSEDVIYSLQCGHVFHQHCLEQLNALSLPRCPLCRCDSTSGVRRLFFSITPDSTFDVDLSTMNDLKDQVKQKSEIIHVLENEIGTMKIDHDKQINALETKIKKIEKMNTNLNRDLKIVKERENRTQKEIKKLSVENSLLLKKMKENVDNKKLKRNDNYQSASESKAKVNLLYHSPQMERKTATSRKALSSLSDAPSTTTSSANLNSNQSGIKPRRIDMNAVKETPSSSSTTGTSIRKARIARQSTPISQSLFYGRYHQAVDKVSQTVNRTRGRIVDGEFRPLRNFRKFN